MSAAVIRAESLSRYYGEVIGLNDITVDVEPGITGLLGPNGAGKSSFLRIVSGEIRPSSGTVSALGEAPFANARYHVRVGTCPEGDRFFDSTRAHDFVTYLMRLHGYSRRDAGERADRALDEVGMTESAGVKLGACSKGMRQRIKLAQAVAHDPELLLLDEPLSGLDPVARHQTQELILRRARAGASVVISSHVLHEVEALTTRILLINKGRIAASGEVSEIRKLIDKHPHRIHLQCATPRTLASLLVDREDVRSLEISEGLLSVETTMPDAFYSDLPELIVKSKLPVTGVSSPDDRLQAVFDYLVEG
jgi:ABC-2 type transport system ATP-binding protein